MTDASIIPQAHGIEDQACRAAEAPQGAIRSHVCLTTQKYTDLEIWNADWIL